MTFERTLCIIKPDAMARGLADAINKRITDAGLRIIARQDVQLTPAQAKSFYAAHSARPFFESLCAFMSSGPIAVQVLAGEGAIARYRTLMGETDPARAAPGTVRRDFAQGIEANAVHGSDSAHAAAREIAFFFSESDMREQERSGSA